MRFLFVFLILFLLSFHLYFASGLFSMIAFRSLAIIYVNTLLCVVVLSSAPVGGIGLRHRPVRMKRILCIKKTMIVITIAFVSCVSWLRSGMERYADRKLSLCCQFFVSGFVGLLTYPFMHRGFSLLHKRIASAFSRSHDSPSNDRFSPRAGISRMENNTLESQLLSKPCRVLAISNVQTADPAMDSFRVRDFHPIPLFSEQACVSDCSGRAFATKAMLFSLYMRA